MDGAAERDSLVDSRADCSAATELFRLELKLEVATLCALLALRLELELEPTLPATELDDELE